MSKISQKNIEQIQSNIISIIYDGHITGLFTSEIAKLEARDKQFVLKLLLGLEKKGIVKQIKISKKGGYYIKRKKWMLTNDAHQKYQELI